MAFAGVDYFLIDSSFSEDELLVRRSTREFVEARVVPLIKDAYNNAQFARA